MVYGYRHQHPKSVHCGKHISVISWQSVLLMGETGVPGENHRPVASHCQTLLHNVVSSTPCHEQGSDLRTHKFKQGAVVAMINW
jgi:hypothetical protein